MKVILLVVLFQLISQLNTLAVEQNSVQEVMENESTISEPTSDALVEMTQQMTIETEHTGETTEETEFPTTTHSSAINLKYSSMSIFSLIFLREILFKLF